MAIYAISDIHGHYATYKKLLEKLKFSENDFLYVVGDVIDRGRDGIKIIQDTMRRPNVELMLGNHELMMLEHLHENALNSECSNVWLNYNGGAYTMTAYRHLRKRDQKRILTAMEKAIIQTTVHVDGIDFIIVHASLTNSKAIYM